jgi:hypothetical protein
MCGVFPSGFTTKTLYVEYSNIHIFFLIL